MLPLSTKINIFIEKIMKSNEFLRMASLKCERVDLNFQNHRFLHGLRGGTASGERRTDDGLKASELKLFDKSV